MAVNPPQLSYAFPRYSILKVEKPYNYQDPIQGGGNYALTTLHILKRVSSALVLVLDPCRNGCS